MLAHLQPVISNTHASSGRQKPLHSGALASPQGVERHSQSLPDAVAAHAKFGAQLPMHECVRSSNWHAAPGTVVVVAPTTVVVVLVDWKVTGPRDAGAQTTAVPRKRMTRCPPNSSVIWVSAGNGFGHFA